MNEQEIAGYGLRGKSENTLTMEMTKETPKTEFIPKHFQQNRVPNTVMYKVLIRVF